MKKLMLSTLVVMALIAAPVLAQETTNPDTPVSAPPGESSETSPEPPGPPPAPAAEPAPPAEEPAPPAEEPAPPPTEPEPTPAPELTPAPPPEVPQEVVADKKAEDDGDLEQGPGNLEAIISALEKEADEQEADDSEAEQVDEESDAIADLRQRLGDPKADIVSPKHRLKAQDDDDDDGPGRSDDDEDEEENGGGGTRQDTDQEAESGDVDQSVDVSNSGDYAQQCVAVIQAANTGNAQNAPASLQNSGDADDFEPGGIGVDISPQLVQDCRQIIRQTTVVNQLSPTRAGQPGAGRPGVVGAGTPPRIAGAGFNAAGSGGRAIANASRLGQQSGGVGQSGGIGQTRNITQPRIQQLNSTPTTAGRLGQLPRTGGPGVVSLLTLGAVLISGGLLVRRFSR